MTTKRSRKHKDLVEYEKKYHHRAGIHLHQHCRTRCNNLVHAVCAESAYEWHKREKQNQELARELNGQFPSRCLWKCPECGTVNVGKENVVDWTVKKCRRCQKMTLIMNLPYKVGARS